MQEVDNSICVLCNTKGELIRTGKTNNDVVVSLYNCCGTDYIDFGKALSEAEDVGHIEVRWDDKS